LKAAVPQQGCAVARKGGTPLFRVQAARLGQRGVCAVRICFVGDRPMRGGVMP